MSDYSFENICNITKKSREINLHIDIDEINKKIHNTAHQGKSIIHIFRPLPKFPDELLMLVEHYKKAGYKAYCRQSDNQLVISWGNDFVNFIDDRED